MNKPTTQSGLRTVRPSLSKRNVWGSSKSHLTGLIVHGENEGRIVGAESHLEFNVALCLSTHPDTADLVEQVEFDWRDEQGGIHTHYFDFAVTQHDGQRIAYTVKPIFRCCGSFAETIPYIADQAKASGEFDDVRLFTDEDLDPIMLFNAKLLHACREAISDVDLLVQEVVRSISQPVSLGELVTTIGLKGDGFRALVRLIRTQHLRLRNHEHISYSAMVYKGKAF